MIITRDRWRLWLLALVVSVTTCGAFVSSQQPYPGTPGYVAPEEPEAPAGR